MICEDRAIIAAGGRGSRMGIMKPKSALEFHGRPLIWYTVTEILRAGCSNVTVLVDDVEWADRFRKLLMPITGVVIHQDRGSPNTLQVFKEAAEVACRYLFTYGHAPRQAHVYKSILRSTSAFAVSGVRHTSMRNYIPLHNGWYAEPPYLVDTKIINIHKFMNWRSLTNAIIPSLAAELLVGEFNTSIEWVRYQAYMTQFWSILEESS